MKKKIMKKEMTNIITLVKKAYLIDDYSKYFEE